jgi:hypothetical protein
MKGRISDKKVTRLNRLGKVKIGKKSEKGYPMSVDYFIPHGNYAGFFTNVYGAKPKTIQIVFISDEASEVCNEHYEYRDNAGKLVAYGDGETFMVHDPSSDEYVERKGAEVMEQVSSWKPNKTGWQITLKLRFILPAIKGLAGYWELSTKGKASSIKNIRDTFDTVQEMNGTAKGILFDLNVEMHQSNKPNSKSRYPVITMFPNETKEAVDRVNGASLGYTPSEGKLIGK